MNRFRDIPPSPSVFRPKKYQSQRNSFIRLHNNADNVVKAISEYADPQIEFQSRQISSNNPYDVSNGICIGHHYKTGKKQEIVSEFIPRNIAILGSNGSGKTTILHVVIYGILRRYNDFCIIYFDWKGEAKESLSYEEDGTPTFLKERIIEITDYKNGMLGPLLGPDKIIILNMLSVKYDETALRTFQYEVLVEIQHKLKYFESEYMSTDANNKKILKKKLPYKLAVASEESYKLYPNQHHSNPVYTYIKQLSRQLFEKRRILSDRIHFLERTGESEWAERKQAEKESIPDLYSIYTKMMLLAQENVNSMRCLGLGSLYSIQRPQDLDTELLSGCNTWIVCKGQNSKADEEILNTSKLDKSLVKEFLRIPSKKQRKYVLVSTPTYKSIVKTNKPFLYHKAKDLESEVRTDLKGVRDLE